MALADVLTRVIGRERLWRLSRRLYMIARGETANDMNTNGERMLLCAVLDLAAASQKDSCVTVFDIGANIGKWSEMALDAASLRGLEATVHGFEPVPSTFEKLVGRFAGRRQFKGLQIALSNSVGTTSFHLVGPGAGTNSLYPSDTTKETISVQTDTGAGYAEREHLGILHFVKVDAEGHDLEVVRGFESLLREQRIWVLQFEYNHRWLQSRSSLFGLFELVDRSYYSVARITPKRLEIIAQWSPELDRFFEGNYALIKNDLLPKLPHVMGAFGPSNVWSCNTDAGRNF